MTPKIVSVDVNYWQQVKFPIITLAWKLPWPNGKREKFFFGTKRFNSKIFFVLHQKRKILSPKLSISFNRNFLFLRRKKFPEKERPHHKFIYVYWHTYLILSEVIFLERVFFVSQKLHQCMRLKKLPLLHSKNFGIYCETIFI